MNIPVITNTSNIVNDIHYQDGQKLVISMSQ